MIQHQTVQQELISLSSVKLVVVVAAPDVDMPMPLTGMQRWVRQCGKPQNPQSHPTLSGAHNGHQASRGGYTFHRDGGGKGGGGNQGWLDHMGPSTLAVLNGAPSLHRPRPSCPGVVPPSASVRCLTHPLTMFGWHSEGAMLSDPKRSISNKLHLSEPTRINSTWTEKLSRASVRSQDSFPGQAPPPAPFHSTEGLAVL